MLYSCVTEVSETGSGEAPVIMVVVIMTNSGEIAIGVDGVY
jgi:hypothetical protein